MSHLHTTARWKAARLAAKRRDGWRCCDCGARGRLEVHHVRPLAKAPELAFCLDNLRTLCRACHIRVTRAERGREEDPRRAAWRAAVNSLCVKA